MTSYVYPLVYKGKQVELEVVRNDKIKKGDVYFLYSIDPDLTIIDVLDSLESFDEVIDSTSEVTKDMIGHYPNEFKDTLVGRIK